MGTAAGRRSAVVVLVLWSVGMVVLAGGIAAVLAADLGAGPLDVVTTAVARLTGWPIGVPITLVNAGLVSLAWFLRGRLGVATVVAAIVLGPLVDGWLLVLESGPHRGSAIWSWALLAAGVTMIGLGGAVQIVSGWGPSPLDAFCVAVSERQWGERHWSLRQVRTATELTFALVGGLAGGALAIGTLVVAVGVGPALAGWLRLVRRSSRQSRPRRPRRHGPDPDPS